MQDQPLISIIIPSYNRESLIAATLTSIVKQDFLAWECIVVDDHSIDKTVSIVNKFVAKDARFKSFKRPESLPKGANSCRNFGFKQAIGTHVIWFDSDDVMLTHDLKTRYANSEGMDVVITTATVTNMDLKPEREFRVENTFDLYRQYAYTKTEMITNSAMFKKSFLAGKQLFDPEIVRGQEADFFLRIFRDVAPDRFAIIANPGFLYRQHPGTKTSQDKTYYPAFKESQLKIYLQNLAYAQQCKDSQLARYMYKQVIPILLESAAHRDAPNMRFGLRELRVLLGEQNKRALRKVDQVVWLTYVLKRISYSFSRKLIHLELQFV